MDQSDDTTRDVNEIAAAANRLGVELDATQAREWMLAVSAAERESGIARDAQTGIFGNRIALLDFDTNELEHFRRLAKLVRAARRPNVESAIAIAGSSAQSKVQMFPGDADFFERVNIHAASEAKAKSILREVMRETALRAFNEPDIVLIEVNLGVYPVAVIERGTPRAAGDPITWTPRDVANGFVTVAHANGEPLTIQWQDADAGRGWTYLGWIIADRDAGRIALASNMWDVTWESPDGKITALDDGIDPFFQEVYLEADAIPVFTKIVKQLDTSAANAYISAMRWQAFHYTHEEPNYGKAAKRLYNLFRVSDQLEAAAYVRELFDEPGAKMYQVPGLLEAADVALRDEHAEIDRDTIVKQIDLVIRAVVEAAEGTREADLVMALVHWRDHVTGYARSQARWETELQSVRKECLELVSEYFRVRLLGLPQIASFVANLKP